MSSAPRSAVWSAVQSLVRSLAQWHARSALRFVPVQAPASPCPCVDVDARSDRSGRRSGAAAEPHRPRVGAAGRSGRYATLAVLVAGAAAGGCALNDPNRSGLLEPYRIDLPQGNYVTAENVDRVEQGMTREQVRFVLGTPLLRDLFHPDRWDYLFRYRFPDGTVEQRKVTVHFRDDRVAAIEADALPQREDATDPALPGYRPPRAQARADSDGDNQDTDKARDTGSGNGSDSDRPDSGSVGDPS